MTSTSVSDRLAALATVLATVAAVAGLALPGLYRDAPNWAQQARGTDLATLFLAVPLLIIGLWTARRGSSVGRLIVVAGLMYVVYNYAIFAFSVAMNPLTVVYIAILGFAIWSLVLAVSSATFRDAGEAVGSRLFRRSTAAVLIGVVVLFGLLWLGQIATTMFTGVVPADLERAGLATNPVYALDLAFFLPLCAVAGIGLIRRNRNASFALPMLIWVPLTSAGILGGFVFSAAAGDEVPIVVAAVLGGLGIVAACVAAVALVRPEIALSPNSA